jgi:predicted hydrocarbon binding protein
MEAVNGELMAMSILLTKGQGALCKAFYQKFGKEALPLLTGVMSNVGNEWGKMMQKSLPVKSMMAIAEQTKLMGSMMGLGTEMLEVSNDKLHFKMSKCPFGFEGTKKDLCEAAMIIDEEKISIFLGQRVDMKIIKTVAAGDKQCEIVFSKK